ncbi:MAG TPA: signal peptide peptidase SppA [Chitinophagaceae bacterium]
MRSFFKIFFASFLALAVFTVVAFLILIAIVGGLAAKDKPVINAKSVMVLDLGQQYKEQLQQNIFSSFTGGENDIPGLYDVVRLIRKAKSDSHIKGIYIIANNNANGFAASEEIRDALIDFKKSKKFIVAAGDVISQKAYHVANVADKLYVNPKGTLEWVGYSVEYVFIKGTLDKLEIEPQIFYAGKFKSATEPLRTNKMTDANKLQTTVWLNDMYNYFLVKAAEERKIDTASLHQLANRAAIRNAKDAFDHKLVDGLKYDDQVKDEFKKLLDLGKYDKINFVSINKYALTGDYKQSGKDRIALIFAEGDIIDGKAKEGAIAGEEYQQLIRKARLDKTVKAIVFRVNSGGGSVLASENIWRELTLAKKEKPVVVSFGDVAASGGYYISCSADSIFASPTTITGSIGVFGIIPNMEAFFKNKLGVTFDGVKTAPYANTGAPYRPMTDVEKQIVQTEIDNIYTQFKQRVSDGRNIPVQNVDSIAQGRVWSGSKAINIGLVDRFGGLQQAVECAARLARLDDYRLKEYPETENILERIFNTSTPYTEASVIKKELGEENYKIFNEMIRIKQMSNSVQARLPFTFFIH